MPNIYDVDGPLGNIPPVDNVWMQATQQFGRALGQARIVIASLQEKNNESMNMWRQFKERNVPWDRIAIYDEGPREIPLPPETKSTTQPKGSNSKPAEAAKEVEAAVNS